VSVVVILLMFLAVVAMVKKVDEDRLSNAISCLRFASSGIQDRTANKQIMVLWPGRIDRVLRCRLLLLRDLPIHATASRFQSLLLVVLHPSRFHTPQPVRIRVQGRGRELPRVGATVNRG
jgi:hypothetical protein